jgi:hypothetical protein
MQHKMNNNKETKKISHNQPKTPTQDCKQQEQQQKKSWQQVSECMRQSKEGLMERGETRFLQSDS